jgi:hypothetical protein
MAHEPRQRFHPALPSLDGAARIAIGNRLRKECEVSEPLPSMFYALLARMDEIDARKIARRYRFKKRGHCETKAVKCR